MSRPLIRSGQRSQTTTVITQTAARQKSRNASALPTQGTCNAYANCTESTSSSNEKTVGARGHQPFFIYLFDF